jgi:hypothetical protein
LALSWKIAPIPVIGSGYLFEMEIGMGLESCGRQK